MKGLIPVLIAWIAIFALGCRKKEMTTYPASSKFLQWHGRVAPDHEGSMQLISSASFLKFRFTGAACKIRIRNEAPANEYNYVSILLDGVYMGRKPIHFDTFTLLEIIPTVDVPFHDLEIHKETEAVCGLVVIRNVEADSLMLLPETRRKKVEFIGNSITVGMAADPSLVPCGSGTWYDQHNAYESYGPRVARALDLDYTITGVSGIGIYRNWSTDGPTMGDVYGLKYMHTNLKDNQWDVKQFVPDIVSINLGTNDLAEGDGIMPRLPFDSTGFIDAYVAFLKTIHHYYPDAAILLLNSSVSGEPNNQLLTNCLLAVKQKAEDALQELKPISVFAFNAFNGNGCTGHPDLDDHKRMAEELIPVIRQLLADSETVRQ